MTEVFLTQEYLWSSPTSAAGQPELCIRLRQGSVQVHLQGEFQRDRGTEARCVRRYSRGRELRRQGGAGKSAIPQFSAREIATGSRGGR